MEPLKYKKNYPISKFDNFWPLDLNEASFVSSYRWAQMLPESTVGDEFVFLLFFYIYLSGATADYWTRPARPCPI